MSSLTLPLNFGERPCDRSLLAYLRSITDNSPAAILWSAFLVWKDFGIARDDRRRVPLSATDRAISHPVTIIEQYCGWCGAPGAFVQAAIQAAFFTLSPIDDSTAELILTDFFPANHSTSRDITNSKLGGIGKGVNVAKRLSAAAADEQLDFFAKTRNPLLETVGKSELREAVMFVHALCKILKRNPPASREWADTLTVKALAVLNATSASDLDATFKWLLANRASQEIPPRLDFLLDRFPEFLSKALKDFR